MYNGERKTLSYKVSVDDGIYIGTKTHGMKFVRIYVDSYIENGKDCIGYNTRI